MSWPADGGPRYVPGAMNQGQNNYGNRETAWWYVYDRAYCHLPILSGETSTRAKAEARAAAEAARLNADSERVSVRALEACEVWGERVTLGGIEWEPSAVPGLADFEP